MEKDKNEGKINYITNGVVAFLFYLVFFKPGIITKLFPSINSIANILLIIVSIIIIFYYIINKKISKIQLTLIAFILTMFISTLLNDGNLYFFCTTYIPALAISIYTELLIKNNIKALMISLSYICAMFIVINFLTVVAFPGGINGMLDVYFLGLDNSAGVFVVLGVTYVLLTTYVIKGKQNFLSIATLIVSYLTFILSGSATPIVGLTLILVFMILIYKKKIISKLLNYKMFLIISLVMLVVLTIFRMQNYFSYFLVDVLQKDLTFNGRTEIWDKVFEQVKDKPLLGTGMEEYSVRKNTMQIYHAHNTYLNVLLEGGLVGFSIYIFMLIVVGKKLKNNSVINSIIGIGFFSYFIMTITEVYYNDGMFFVFLVIGYYSSNIQEFYDEIRIGGKQNESR